MTDYPAAGALAERADRPSLLAIFIIFSRLALQGFGGVLPFAYRSLVERERWLSAEEFAKCLAMSQILPGPTICNVGAMVGHRYGGIPGALAAVAGLIAGPFCVVIALAAVYQRFGDLTMFRHALSGMIAVAAGLVLSTALKMSIAMFSKSGLRDRNALLKIVLLAAAFIALGVLRWQLILVFGVIAPAGAIASYLMGEKK